MGGFWVMLYRYTLTHFWSELFLTERLDRYEGGAILCSIRCDGVYS